MGDEYFLVCMQETGAKIYFWTGIQLSMATTPGTHLFRIFLSDTLQNSFLRPFIYCADLQYDHQNND